VTRTKRIRNRRAPLLFLLLLFLLIARTRQYRGCSRTITKILLSRIVMMRCNGHFNHDYNLYFIARPTVSSTKRKNNAKRVSVKHEIEKGQKRPEKHRWVLRIQSRLRGTSTQPPPTTPPPYKPQSRRRQWLTWAEGSISMLVTSGTLSDFFSVVGIVMTVILADGFLYYIAMEMELILISCWTGSATDCGTRLWQRVTPIGKRTTVRVTMTKVKHRLTGRLSAALHSMQCCSNTMRARVCVCVCVCARARMWWVCVRFAGGLGGAV